MSLEKFDVISLNETCKILGVWQGRCGEDVFLAR